MTWYAEPMLLRMPGFYILLAALVLALLLAVRRGRGPIRLAAPRCTACGHPVGDGIERCPECGSAGTDRGAGDALTFGRRCLSWRWIAGSLLLVLLVAGLGLAVAYPVQKAVGMPWPTRPYRNLDLPALSEVIARNPADIAASRELMIKARKAASNSELAAELTLAFELHANGVPDVSQELAASLSAIRAAGLPDQEWWQLLTAVIPDPPIEARRRQRAGRQLAVRIGHPFWGGSHVGTASIEAARLDGQPLQRVMAGLAQWGRNGVAIFDLPGFFSEEGSRTPSAGASPRVSAMTLEVDWVQAVSPAGLPPSTPALNRPLDISGAEWFRRGTITSTIELVYGLRAEQFFDLETYPALSPWPRGLADIAYLELREVDNRTLIVFDATPHRRPDQAVVGTWTLRQGERAVQLCEMAQPALFGFPDTTLRTSLLVEPPLDATQPFSLEFTPDAGTAERESTLDALWWGKTEILVEPEDLTFDETGGVRARVHRGRAPASAQP